MSKLQVLLKYGDVELQDIDLVALRALWKSEMVITVEILIRGDSLYSLRNSTSQKLSASQLNHSLNRLEQIGLVRSVPIELSQVEREILGPEPRYKCELTDAGGCLMLEISREFTNLYRYSTTSLQG